MPPETPVKGLQSAHIFRLLRPEYVKQYHIPLCSDAVRYIMIVFFIFILVLIVFY